MRPQRAPILLLTLMLALMLAACGGAVTPTSAPSSASAATPAASAAASSVGTGTPAAAVASPTPDCSAYLAPPEPSQTPTGSAAPAPVLQLAVTHAEVLAFSDFPEVECIAVLQLRITVTNKGTTPVRIQEQNFWFEVDGMRESANGRLMEDLAASTGEPIFTVAGTEIQPGASATGSIVVRPLIGAPRYTLTYEQRENRRIVLTAELLDVTATVTRAMAAPSRAVGPRPAATPSANFQVTLATPTVRRGESYTVRGSGFTVPPLSRGPSRVASLAVGLESFGDTPPLNNHYGAPLDAAADGTFEYDSGTSNLVPGQYTVVVMDWVRREVVYRGPILIVTAP